MSAPRASVVVVTTTNAAGLERCLRSLAALGLEEPPFETIVVLNGAEDDVRALAARAQGVTVVESVVNRGLAGGANFGRAVASGEFVVVLHDDAEAEPGWLSALVRCAEEHPEAGAVGSRVLNPDGTLQLAGAVIWRDGTTSSVSGADGDFPRRRAADYAGSTALLVRAVTWDAVGGMDEELYPAYYVDADFATAIRANGEAVLYEPSARVRHVRGASSTNRMRTYLTARNRERYCAKWGDRLPEHADPGDLDAALRRAEREAARFAAAGPPPRGGLSPAPPTDERRFLQLDREVRNGLIAQLTEEVESLHATIRRKDEELVAQETALRELHARAQ